MTSVPAIIVAQEDRERLIELATRIESEVAERLEEELERAHVVPLAEVPEDVVVMNAELEYEDAASHERRTLRLVYPADADLEGGRVSILAPLGCALLGLRVGQSIDWQMPGGKRKLRVLAVKRRPAPAA